MCYLEWNLDGNITLFIFAAVSFYLAIREPMHCTHSPWGPFTKYVKHLFEIFDPPSPLGHPFY